MTFADLERFLKESGLADQEYFHLTDAVAPRKGDPLWQRGVRFVAVWWVPGANEGYYVHVDRALEIERQGRAMHEYKRPSEPVALGKFWSPEDAGMACWLITRFVYEMAPADALVAEAREYWNSRR